MRKIIIYLIICISSFSIWLSNEEMLINEKNRGVEIYNTGTENSKIIVEKLEEYIPIFSENGKQIFTKTPEKEYYKVSFDLYEYLKNRNIENLNFVKITNENYEKIDNLKVYTVDNQKKIIMFNAKESFEIINFLGKSNELTISFGDDNGKYSVQKFYTSDFKEAEKLIKGKRILLKTQELLDKELIMKEDEYIKYNLRIKDVWIYKNQDTAIVRFSIENLGSRDIKKLKVIVIFLDDNGNIIRESEYFPVYEEGLYGIFKANTEYILKENDYFYTDKMPSNWNGRYEIKIKEIEYN